MTNENVINELFRFKNELESLYSKFKDKDNVTFFDRDSLNKIKAELRLANKYGTVDGKKRDQSDYEKRHFRRAVSQALQEISSKYSGPTSLKIANARMAIDSVLYDIEKENSGN